MGLESLGGLFKKKGLQQFSLRAIILGSLILSAYLFIFLYFRHTVFFKSYLNLSNDYYLPFLTGLKKTDFLNASLFTLILAVIWNRDAILSQKQYSQSWKESMLFFCLSILSLSLHYFMKYIVGVVGIEASLPVIAVKYMFNALFIVFLALAVFNLKFFKEHQNKLIQVPFFMLILFSYFMLIQYFQKSWTVMGNLVAKVIYYLLHATFGEAYIDISAFHGIRLGTGDFIVEISNACSGIDSLLLFISLYLVIFALDWNILNKKRMMLLLLPGIAGAIIYNIFRVYLIMLVGVLINPEFAIDVFHTNIGWIMFLGFFVIYWYFGSKWVYLPKHRRPAKAKQ